jgi:hypothetical protein
MQPSRNLGVGAALGGISLVAAVLIGAATTTRSNYWCTTSVIAALAITALVLSIGLWAIGSVYLGWWWPPTHEERIARRALAASNFPRSELAFPAMAVEHPEQQPNGYYKYKVVLGNVRVTNREKTGMSLGFGLKLPTKNSDPEYIVFTPDPEDGLKVPANVAPESSLYGNLVFRWHGDNDDIERFEWNLEKRARWLHIVDHVTGTEIELPIPGRWES